MSKDKKFTTFSDIDVFLLLLILMLVVGLYIHAFCAVTDRGNSLIPARLSSNAVKNSPQPSARSGIIPILPASGSTEASIFTDAISRAAKSTCKIATGHSVGTGFIVYSGQSAMWIMTCEHVVSSATKSDVIKAMFGSGGEIPYTVYDCRLISKNKGLDTALLVAARKPSDPVLPLPIRANKPVVVGEPIMAFGCPLGVPNVCTFGRVATLARPTSSAEMQFIADMSGVPGMSGSPVLDAEGYVVGMVEAVLFNRNAYTDGTVSIPELYPLGFITDATVLSKFLNQNLVINKAPAKYDGALD